MAKPESGPDTPSIDGAAARLRATIDAGATGEKINHPDPAAAPLGTDDEAAGQQSPGSVIDREARAAIASSRQAGRPDGYAATPSAKGGLGTWVALLAVIAVLVAGIFTLLATR